MHLHPELVYTPEDITERSKLLEWIAAEIAANGGFEALRASPSSSTAGLVDGQLAAHRAPVADDMRPLSSPSVFTIAKVYTLVPTDETLFSVFLPPFVPEGASQDRCSSTAAADWVALPDLQTRSSWSLGPAPASTRSTCPTSTSITSSTATRPDLSPSRRRCTL